ncbi:hypothetical protein [Gordonia iterans]
MRPDGDSDFADLHFDDEPMTREEADDTLRWMAGDGLVPPSWHPDY